MALLGEACGDAAPQDLSGEGDGRFPFMRGADGADAPKLVDAQMVGFIAESGSEGVACALEPGNFALRGPSSAGQSISKGAPEGTKGWEVPLVAGSGEELFEPGEERGRGLRRALCKIKGPLSCFDEVLRPFETEIS